MVFADLLFALKQIYFKILLFFFFPSWPPWKLSTQKLENSPGQQVSSPLSILLAGLACTRVNRLQRRVQHGACMMTSLAHGLPTNSCTMKSTRYKNYKYETCSVSWEFSCIWGPTMVWIMRYCPVCFRQNELCYLSAHMKGIKWWTSPELYGKMII